MTGDADEVPEEPTYGQLAAQNAALTALVAELREANQALVERVSQLEARLGKNSQNSSKPPSSDAFTKPAPRSLRKKSGRRAGKQPGAAGARLEPREKPDEIVVHQPSSCRSCGSDLDGAPVVGEQVRQVLDLPPIELVAIEHRAQRRACSCGAVTTATFPAEATAPVCYGPGVAALGTYLLARQHLPVDRAAEAMADCFGVPVSTGWLTTLLPGAAARLGAFTDLLRQRLRAAPVTHFDETGGRVAKKLRWIHVACTGLFTFYHLDDKRGMSAIDAAAVLPGMCGVAVHDGHTPYRRYDVTHGLCNAHHLRELAGIAETTGQEWPTKLADLLVEIHTTVQGAKASDHTKLAARRLAEFTRRYDALIAEGQEQNPPPPRTGKRGRPKLGPAASLLRRLDQYRDDVLRFATDFTVPFDNNQAERDIRMVKIQQKISGGWRSETGARAFLTVRSYCPPHANTTAPDSTSSANCSPATPGCPHPPAWRRTTGSPTHQTPTT